MSWHLRGTIQIQHWSGGDDVFVLVVGQYFDVGTCAERTCDIKIKSNPG